MEAALRHVGDAEQGEPLTDAPFDGFGVPTPGPFCFWSISMKESTPGNQASHGCSHVPPCICAGYECGRRARVEAKRLRHASGPGFRQRHKPSVESDAIQDCRPPAVRRCHCERARSNLINDLRAHAPLPRRMLGRGRRRAEDHERPSHHSGMSDAPTVTHSSLRKPRTGDGGHSLARSAHHAPAAGRVPPPVARLDGGPRPGSLTARPGPGTHPSRRFGRPCSRCPCRSR